MKKAVVKIVIGLLITLSGFGILGFIYLDSKLESHLVWLIALSAALIATGIFFLYKAMEEITRLSTLPIVSENAQEEGKHTKSIVERNNEMLSDWSKTNSTRDKLKVLQMAAKVEEE